MRKPVAYLDVANRHVELDLNVVFKTPTVADLGPPVGLYLEREWVDLTPEEIDDLVAYPWGETKDWVAAVAAKLKEKNT